MTRYRYLTHRHAHRILTDTRPELEAGEVRLHSFYLPSLQGGTHTAKVTQTLKFPNIDPKLVDPISESQDFRVVLPQYNIPHDAVESTYPPPGEGVEARTLPHVVFKDPHLPWYRGANGVSDDKDMRNKVPWVALLSFTQDELLLEPWEKAQIFELGEKEKTVQSETLSVKMTVRDLQSLRNSVPIKTPENKDDPVYEESTEVIFIKPELFSKLFVESEKVNVRPFKYLSHVKKVGLEGMVSAVNGEVGTYGVTICHRAGVIDPELPTPIICHLVSIEFVQTLSPVNSNRIALTSLYSWTYNSFPKGAFNAFQTLKSLGEKTFRGVLRPVDVTTSDSPDDAVLEEAITKRRQDGYNIVRHRTITGEETAAIFRGPLTPNFVKSPMREGFTMSSNFGTDLQILDPDLSLMDISYASAWQLGKTLAMGDRAFATALARLRNTIHSAALKASKIEVHSELGVYSSRGEVAQGMIDLVTGLNTLNVALSSRKLTACSTNRWKYTATDQTVDFSYRSPHIKSRFSAHATSAAEFFASSTDGGQYNEHNCPNNTDFAHVLEWVMDKLYLANIPAHYLIPDPSFLPDESLRFFHVDWNWTDAMIDGALSLANHWASSPAEDECRIAIKKYLNKHIFAKDPALKYRPQMPAYGFLMRSRLLVQFPDLAVTAKFGPKTMDVLEETPVLKEKPGAPILIQRLLAPDTMLCLFDCAPPELESLSFTIPPHQQFFSVGSQLDSEDGLVVLFKKIYLNNAGTPEDRRQGLGPERFGKASEYFNWDGRTMNIEKYVNHVRAKLNKEMQGNYTDKVSTSALLCVQLTEPIYALDIKVPAPALGLSCATQVFQLSVPESAFASVMKTPLQPDPKEKPLGLSRVRRNTTPQAPPQPILIRQPTANTAPTGPPEFVFNIYSLRNPKYIRTLEPLRYDLIFSICRVRDGYSGNNLKRFRVEVPRGEKDKVPLPIRDDDPGPRGSTWPMIKLDYTPAPPVMVSNMRFDVIRRWSPDKHFLYLDVVPRSADGVPVSKIREASFILGMVDICDWTDCTKSYVSCKHSYHGLDKIEHDNGDFFEMRPEKLPGGKPGCGD